MTLQMSSDKFRWHRYERIYDQYFDKLKPTDILEFGVLNGESIEYYLSRWPKARIVGADIMRQQDHPEWPPNAVYVHMDQGSQADIDRLFVDYPGPYDFVLDDGSHVPSHQAACMIASMAHIKSGGLYVLEDLQTSTRDKSCLNSYNLLLGFEYLKATQQELDPSKFVNNSLFSAEQVRQLWDSIESIDVYQRALLPLYCYRCKQSNPNFNALACSNCNENWLAHEVVDSVTAVIKVK